MRSYPVVLFDLDGTLIDTVGLIVESYRHLGRVRFGREVSPEEVVPLIGMPLRDQFRRLFPVGELEAEGLVDEFMAYQYTVYRDFLRPFDGVVEVLEVLKGRGVRTGVVTSRRRESAELYTRETGLRGWLDVLVAMEDTERHKPGPEPVWKALELLGAEASSAVMVGDADFDMRAGKAAGTATAFAMWGPNRPESLTVEPDWMLRTPWDLVG